MRRLGLIVVGLALGMMVMPAMGFSADGHAELQRALARAGVTPDEQAAQLATWDASSRALRQAPAALRPDYRSVRTTVRQIAARSDFRPELARAIFAELAANTVQIGRGDYPTVGSRVRVNGLVFERYRGQGLRIQPLATFWAVLEPGNEITREGGPQIALDRALAIAVPRGDALTLPYLFAWMGTSPPWRSAMAEGVAAQAAVAVWQLTGEERYLEIARAFGRGVLGVSVRTRTGVWFPLYAFAPSYRVFNGHYQATIAMGALAEATGDDRFRTAFTQGLAMISVTLAQAGARGRPRYSPGDPAPRKYHRLMIAQMEELALLTGVERYAIQADRWRSAP